MFETLTRALYRTARFGKVDTPSVSAETLEMYNDLYDRATEGADEIHALVLGATPELRDIVLANRHHTLTTIDRDAEAVKVKTAQMHYANNKREEVLTRDWLDLDVDLSEDTFDVVMGDGVLSALPQEDQKRLLELIHYVLKPTGTLILRESTVLHRRPRYEPSMHVTEYRRGQYNLYDLFFGLRLYNNNFKAINTETRKTYLKEFDDKVDEYFASGLLSKEEHNELKSVADELEHTLLRKEDLEDILKSYFFPKAVVHDSGSGHLSPWYFFQLQPNDQIELPEHVPAVKQDYVRAFLAEQANNKPEL